MFYLSLLIYWIILSLNPFIMTNSAGIGNDVYSSPNLHSNVIETESVPFVDPNIHDILKNDDFNPLSLLLVYDTHISDNYLDALHLLQEIHVVRVYHQFSTVQITLTQNNIENLLDTSGLEGIYLNTPRNVDSLEPLNSPNSKKSQIMSSDDPLGFNVNEYLQLEEIQSQYNLSTEQIQGNDVVIAIVDAGMDLFLEDMLLPGLENSSYSSYLSTIQENFMGLSSDVNISYDIIGAVSMVPYEPLSYTDFRGDGTHLASLIAGEGENLTSYNSDSEEYMKVKCLSILD